MLKEETWMDGTQCVSLGFADQLVPAVQAMAHIDSKRIEEYEKCQKTFALC